MNGTMLKPTTETGWNIRHQLPGRVRLYNAAIRGDASLADAVGQMFIAEPGVTAVEVSAATGTVLIRFDDSIQSVGALLNGLGTHPTGALLPYSPPEETGLSLEEELDGVVVKAARVLRYGAIALDTRLKASTGGRANLRQAVLGLLAARVAFIMAQTGATSWVSVESLVEWVLAFTLYQNPRAEAEYRIAKSYAFAGP